MMSSVYGRVLPRKRRMLPCQMTQMTWHMMAHLVPGAPAQSDSDGLWMYFPLCSAAKSGLVEICGVADCLAGGSSGAAACRCVPGRSRCRAWRRRLVTSYDLRKTQQRGPGISMRHDRCPSPDSRHQLPGLALQLDVAAGWLAGAFAAKPAEYYGEPCGCGGSTLFGLWSCVPPATMSSSLCSDLPMAHGQCRPPATARRP
ncbi:hypothetical protein O181_024438 [Austropuccinia psidii MF-1]|uniref:Uncharacterized protein n=1 Tax=Austropuccinia psidii MF-1 TaxID=1389203 RepID=A0A9Q3CKS8_9BASI|nr:hypothetical protein [Austropuccinia psidii MF-1]